MVRESLFKAMYAEVLTESAIATGKLGQAGTLIASYLKKKTGSMAIALPYIEHFKNGSNEGYGLRVVLKRNVSVRFNWSSKSSAGSNAVLDSVDFWTGKESSANPAPSFHLELSSAESLVKILPFVAAAVEDWSLLKTNKVVFAHQGLNESIDFSQKTLDEIPLVESANVYEDFIDLISRHGGKLAKGKAYAAMKSQGNKVFDAIAAVAPSLLQKQGSSLVYIGTEDDFKELATSGKLDKVLAPIKGTITKGTGTEKQISGAEISTAVEEAERVSYEQLLTDLVKLIKMIVAGVTNAVFVGGRGGIGKTHNVESALGEMGLSDGSGYVKVTGSASAAGMFVTLYKNRDKIILFDDADSIFKDQESRNLLKAATDTKKVRKLFWLKKSSSIVDPGVAGADEQEQAEYFEENPDQAPNQFEFTGRVIFISNLRRDQLDPDGALRTRGFLIDINPTEEEVWDYLEKIIEFIPIEAGLTLDKKERLEVIELLRGQQKAGDPANLRKAVRGLNVRAAFGHEAGWEDVVTRYC